MPKNVPFWRKYKATTYYSTDNHQDWHEMDDEDFQVLADSMGWLLRISFERDYKKLSRQQKAKGYL